MYYNKPLVRWTIGNVDVGGWESLKKSIKILPRSYPEFDLVLCHNNLTSDQINNLTDMGIKTYKQTQNYLKVGSSGWKLIPPRLRIESHELWLDNDVIIQKRLPSIDKWLESKTGIISHGLYGLYGKYKKFIKEGLNLNAGVFGLPAYFDFEQKINELYNLVLESLPLNMPFDEQGLVSTIISNIPGFIKIPKEEIIICERGSEVKLAVAGMHFVGINRGNKEAWQIYKKNELGKIKII
jgi:hypothetical protein